MLLFKKINAKKHSFRKKNLKNSLKLLFLILLFWANSAILVLAQTETFIPGSYIINMGIVPQTVNNGLKPYGLIYDLLKNDKIPVKWIISPTKAKDGVDFTYNGIQYKGGSFIIPAEFITAAFSSKISGYGLSGVYATSSLTVKVIHTLNSAPRWTLDAQNGAIAAKFFVNAAIPTSAYNYKDPQTLASCDDIFVMPHADPTWVTHSNLYTWNRNNLGAIWAGCHAVSVLENLNNGSDQMNFLATNVGPIGNALVPFGSHANATIPYTHQLPTSPAAQYMGITDGAHTNGSEQVFLPKLGGGWRPTTEIIAYDPTQINVPSLSPGPAALIATGRAFGNSNYGWVMYEAGHDITKAANSESVAAQRAFFDFSLRAMPDKIPALSGVTVPSVIYSATGISISANSPTGAGLTYLWTSSCGGTFSNASAANTVYTYSPFANKKTIAIGTFDIISCNLIQGVINIFYELIDSVH
jgi:hypothetical protein